MELTATSWTENVGGTEVAISNRHGRFPLEEISPLKISVFPKFG